MSVVKRYIDPNILTYLKENCRFVEAYGETYYWKRFNNFNLFFNLFKNLDIASHERGLDGKPLNIGADELLCKYKFWYELNYDEFMKMISEVELFDKKLSLVEKYKSIEQDF